MALVVTTIVLVGSVLTALFCSVRLNRSGDAVRLDWAIVVVPPALWMALDFTGIHNKTLSNIIEPLLLLIVSSVGFVVRTLAATVSTAKARSMTALAVGMTMALLLYAVVPALPE